MNIKKVLVSFIGITILFTLILSSCSTTDSVVSSNIIQKRKYNNGYYTSVFFRKHNTQFKETVPKIISEIKEENNQKILSNNASVFMASVDGIGASSQALTSYQQNEKLSDNYKFIHKSQIDKNLEKVLINAFYKPNYSDTIKSPVLNKPKINKLALASIISGSLSFVIIRFSFFLYFLFFPIFLPPVGAILAILFGLIALRQIKNNPSKGIGREYALGGIILGIAMVALMLLAVLLLILLT